MPSAACRCFPRVLHASSRIFRVEYLTNMVVTVVEDSEQTRELNAPLQSWHEISIPPTAERNKDNQVEVIGKVQQDI